jgi:phosphoglucosamine mutase
VLSFGTDGVRGVANADLTPEVALALGRAAARILLPSGGTFYVGRDTRRSSPMLGAAVAAGLASQGVDVVDLGVLPTPGVAHLASADDVPAVMISASHNPFPDNGIKLFAAGGRKLDDDTEAAVEADLHMIMTIGGPERPKGAGVGDISPGTALSSRYVDSIVAALEGRDLSGMKVVVDCGHGAAWDVAPRALTRLGADVLVLHAQPDGVNINDGCGSTHLERLQTAVVAQRAACGVAFDGDADRCLAVDGNGNTVDGDELMAICGLDMRDRDRLAKDTIVVTVMSNLGFHLAMHEADIAVEVTPVGDRYVSDRMDQGGFSLGGEQSGHLIFADYATTGDGLLTATLLLDILRRSGRSLADLASAVTRLPQVLLNVHVVGDARALLEDNRAIWDEVDKVEAELGDHGRVLLRASGTEPLVRVMVEAPTEEKANEAARRIAAQVPQT